MGTDLSGAPHPHAEFLRRIARFRLSRSCRIAEAGILLLQNTGSNESRLDPVATEMRRILLLRVLTD